MKRLLLCLMTLVLLTTVCGCTGNPEQKATQTHTPNTYEAEVSASAQTLTEVQTEPAAADAPAPQTEEDVLDTLDGTWELLPRGELLRMEPYATLRIDRMYRTVTYTRATDGEYVGAHFTLSDLFAHVQGTYDLMELYPDDLSDNFIENGDEIVFGTRADFEIRFAVSQQGMQMLALREIGNGNTALAMDGIGYDNCAGDGYWVFERVTDDTDGTDAPVPKTTLRKGETFYAFRWRDDGATCELQPMEIHSYEENWYGEMTTVLEFGYTGGADALTAATYTIAGKADEANSGGYRTGMVRVTTDKNGEITAIEPVEYLAYGAYTAS